MEAMDTETINRLGHGEACLIVRTMMDGVGTDFKEFPQSWDDIFNFLAAYVRTDGEMGKYCCWNMDFDAKAIANEHFLPWREVEKLGIYGACRVGEYRFRYIPGKYFSCINGKLSFQLYDVCQFYGCSLRAAAAKHGLSEQKEDIPAAWYRCMDRVLRKPDSRAKVLEYAARDAQITYRLWSRLQDEFERYGLGFTSPISPGNLAGKYYADSFAASRSTKLVNNEFAPSLYGGRVEVYTMGRVGKCSMYDIRSAYPWAISTLPKVVDGRLRMGRVPNPSAIFGCYRVQVDCPVMLLGPLAVRRRDGVVVYPIGRFRTICGKQGLMLLEKRKIPFKVERCVEWLGQTDGPLFPDIHQLYASKSGAGGWAAKLILNSIYGKLCERVDRYIPNELLDDLPSRAIRRDRYGPLASMPYAAHITEMVRLRLWETMMGLWDIPGTEVYMTATDSILTNGEIPGIGDGMGMWSRKEYLAAEIYGCGRYVLYPLPGENDGNPIIRIRGFDCTAENLSRIQSAKRSTMLRVFRTMSLREWSRAGCLADANVLQNYRRQFRSEDCKRYWPGKRMKLVEYGEQRRESLPWIYV